MAAADNDNALGRTVFFIGAGCSASAGIPLASDIAKALALRLAAKMQAEETNRTNAVVAYRWLASSKIIRDCCAGELPTGGADTREIDWPRVYDALFDEHYTVPDEVRTIFSEFVETAGGNVNWAHLCLGELVKRKLVSTVITTNFDQLALAGIVRSGELPVVCDGIESLSRISGLARHPQLIELHGSRHTYRLRNSRVEVAEVGKDRPAITAIGSIFQSLTTLILVGYGGREDGVMDLLIDAAERFPDKRLIWVMHGKDPGRLPEKAAKFLATSRTALLLVDQDADSFFLRLLQALGIGAPQGIREPLMLVDLHASTLAIPTDGNVAESANIVAEVERHRNEITALKKALNRHRKKQTATEAAITTARELRLAGNLSAALKILRSASKRSNDISLWSQIGEVALELSVKSAERNYLETAIAAWRRVLNSSEGRSAPLDRARYQFNLGISLWRLGERESGTARLEEAVIVLRGALKERTRDRVPLEWAATQTTLGNALLRLGEHQDEPTRIKEAIDAYRASLLENTRERVPLEWATTQNNLGAALWLLGERENDTGRLNEAVTAYRDALKERTQERAPLEWAHTQNNLGNALWSFGKRESGTTKLEEAIIAYRDALKVRTRERTPLEWAMSQDNMGISLTLLGERENGTARLEQAIEAYRAALTVYETAKASHYIEGTRNNLARAEARLWVPALASARPGRQQKHCYYLTRQQHLAYRVSCPGRSCAPW